MKNEYKSKDSFKVNKSLKGLVNDDWGFVPSIGDKFQVSILLLAVFNRRELLMVQPTKDEKKKVWIPPQTLVAPKEDVFYTLERMLDDLGRSISREKLQIMGKDRNLQILGSCHVFESGQIPKLFVACCLPLQDTWTQLANHYRESVFVHNEFQLWNLMHGVAPTALVAAFESVNLASKKKMITWDCKEPAKLVSSVPRAKIQNLAPAQAVTRGEAIF